MNHFALGYLAQDRNLPHGLTLSPLANFHIVTGPCEILDNERSRLSALQSCFEAGLDVVPFAPRRAILLAAALEHGRNNNLAILGALSRIAGRGQLSLTVRKPATENPAPVDGRAWLASRFRNRNALDNLHEWLANLADRAAYPASEIHETRKALTVALMVPRTEQGRALDDLRNIAAKSEAPTPAGARLSVSGLWPALAFAGRHLNERALAT